MRRRSARSVILVQSSSGRALGEKAELVAAAREAVGAGWAAWPRCMVGKEGGGRWTNKRATARRHERDLEHLWASGQEWVGLVEAALGEWDGSGRESYIRSTPLRAGDGQHGAG